MAKRPIRYTRTHAHAQTHYKQTRIAVSEHMLDTAELLGLKQQTVLLWLGGSVVRWFDGFVGLMLWCSGGSVVRSLRGLIVRWFGGLAVWCVGGSVVRSSVGSVVWWFGGFWWFGGSVLRWFGGSVVWWSVVWRF